MKKLKIAVVGPGLIGREHVKLIHASDRCELVAIIAPDKKIHKKYTLENNAHFYDSLNQSFEAEKIDGVIIASPNRYHFEQAIDCIEANIPVLIEKPIAASLKEGIEIARRAKESRAKVLVGHHRTYSPIMTKAREIIQSGKIGKVVSIMGSAQFYKPKKYFEAGAWRKIKGGGPILINLIHEVGNLRSLCGDIDSVQALASSAVRGFEVEDTVAINFRFRNGVLGTFMLSDTAASCRSWEQTSGENPNYASYPNDEAYLVSGTQGSLSIPTMLLRYYAPQTEASWWEPFNEMVIPVERSNPLEGQLNHFLDVIQGTAQAQVSAEDGLQNLWVTEAVSEAASNSNIVYL